MPPAIVSVFAHPDDEAFGVGGSFARAVAEGARAAAICATRGEVGEIADPRLATPETLGAVREQELRAGCRELGVHDVRFLGYRDSGMAGAAENADPRAFMNADDEEVIARLLAIFRELRPDVVVTFEPEGVYGHPDHKKISRCATATFDRAAADGWRPSRLYFSGASRSAFRELLSELKRAGIEGFPFADQVEIIGMPDEEITAVVDVSPWLDRKRRAFAAHRTQISPWLQKLGDEWRDRLFRFEHFAQARGEITAASRTDLIGGLG